MTKECSHKVWSNRANCYRAIYKNRQTFLYYKCLDTVKKTTLTYNGLLALSNYEGRTGPLVTLV